jgi:hypothetical protein
MILKLFKRPETPGINRIKEPLANIPINFTVDVELLT